MSKKKEQNFAEAFAELEEMTKWFDVQENVDLDEGLKKFERGLELAHALKKQLNVAENKVEEIKKKFV